MNIWILYIIVLLHGKPAFASSAFESMDACNAAKATYMKVLAAEHPDDPSSLTCFKPSNIGKPT